MKVALLGYGKMGRAVERLAERERIEVTAVVDPACGARGEIGTADVCIDFSGPDAALDNIRLAASVGLPIVVGTTGWYSRINEARQIVLDNGIGLVYGSNFSLGVNLMFNLTRKAAREFSRFLTLYDPFIEEAHHKTKKDAPSGTALVLKRILETEYGSEVPTVSLRAGYLPGTHVVGFDSEADTLTITHTARGREGFAEGALFAAKWICGKTGFHEFSELVEEHTRA